MEGRRFGGGGGGGGGGHGGRRGKRQRARHFGRNPWGEGGTAGGPRSPAGAGAAAARLFYSACGPVRGGRHRRGRRGGGVAARSSRAAATAAYPSVVGGQEPGGGGCAGEPRPRANAPPRPYTQWPLRGGGAPAGPARIGGHPFTRRGGAARATAPGYGAVGARRSSPRSPPQSLYLLHPADQLPPPPHPGATPRSNGCSQAPLAPPMAGTHRTGWPAPPSSRGSWGPRTARWRPSRSAGASGSTQT